MIAGFVFKVDCINTFYLIHQRTYMIWYDMFMTLWSIICLSWDDPFSDFLWKVENSCCVVYGLQVEWPAYCIIVINCMYCLKRYMIIRYSWPFDSMLRVFPGWLYRSCFAEQPGNLYTRFSSFLAAFDTSLVETTNMYIHCQANLRLWSWETSSTTACWTSCHWIFKIWLWAHLSIKVWKVWTSRALFKAWPLGCGLIRAWKGFYGRSSFWISPLEKVLIRVWKTWSCQRLCKYWPLDDISIGVWKVFCCLLRWKIWRLVVILTKGWMEWPVGVFKEVFFWCFFLFLS